MGGIVKYLGFEWMGFPHIFFRGIPHPAGSE
jgi:hypothetical protein